MGAFLCALDVLNLRFVGWMDSLSSQGSIDISMMSQAWTRSKKSRDTSNWSSRRLQGSIGPPQASRLRLQLAGVLHLVFLLEQHFMAYEQGVAQHLMGKLRSVVFVLSATIDAIEKENPSQQQCLCGPNAW
jgi:hypothetical protein